ncbi:MAG: acetolactate decarboxylase [Methanoregula sp.]|nr:acetolactate decarboxylase [Methanoregula sp.]
METQKFLLGIGLAIVIVFCGASVYTHFIKVAPTPADRETFYQVSTIDALMQGVFDGVQPVADLKKHGDFGIGTFDALDGEMIVLDGVVYQAKADGRIYVAADTQTTPFATVTYFDRDQRVTTDMPMNLSAFSSVMEKRLPTGNLIYAVRMHGTFPLMKVRAIPAQQEPYPTLADAAKNQSIYTYSDTTGTVVGFYTPVFFKGVNIAGYHLHFISDDRTTGGHILDFTVPANTTVEYDITPGFSMALPTSGDFTGVDLSQDLSADLAKIEK